MDKKPFLRGFGTGVLFAAAILGISFTIRTSEPATIARAKKLGMVFENNNQKGVLSGTKEPEETALPETSGNPDSTALPDVTEVPQDTTKPAATQKPADKATEKPDVTEAPGVTKKPSKKDNDTTKQFEDEKNKIKKEIEDEKKQLTINDGDWAGKVSKKLEDMGIIDDAVAFDKYLSDNGYSNVIHSGTYDVSPDDTYKDLAEKITSHFGQ